MDTLTWVVAIWFIIGTLFSYQYLKWEEKQEFETDNKTQFVTLVIITIMGPISFALVMFYLFRNSRES